MLGRVHHDDHPEAADELGVLGQRRQVDAVGARQALPVAVGGDDVGEARQGVEAVALAEVHGRLVAEAAVDLGRVVEVLGRERVELDCGRGHGASWKATHASAESIAFRRTIVSLDAAQRVADEGRLPCFESSSGPRATWADTPSPRSTGTTTSTWSARSSTATTRPGATWASSAASDRSGSPPPPTATPIVALDADCVLYMPQGEIDPMGALDDICRLLASGKNVVSTAVTAFIYPASAGDEVVDRLEAACAEGGTSFHGTGIEPGWAGEVLPLTMSGILGRVDSILVQELMDYSTYDSTDMMFDIMGFGLAARRAGAHGRRRPGRLDVPGPADAARRRPRRHDRALHVPPRGGGGRPRRSPWPPG